MPFVTNVPLLWQRIRNRFNTHELGGTHAPLIPDYILPVTNVDDILAKSLLAVATKDISAGSGSTIFHTVPDGKTWDIIAIHRGVTTAASQVLVFNAGETVAFNLTVASTAETPILAGKRWVMPTGWTLRMGNTGNGADTAREMTVWYEEEDSFQT